MSHRISSRTALAAALISLGFAVSAVAQTSGGTGSTGSSATSSSKGMTQGAGGTTGSRSGPTGASATGSSSGSMGTSGSMAGSASASASPSLASADKSFILKAAEGGMAEVELGRLAAQKGSSEQVKQFGQRMVDDHSKANDQLKQIASSKGVSLPSDLAAKDKRERDRLSKLSGAQFDKAYMDHMVADHKKDVNDFKSEASKAKDPDVKSFASSTLPTLQEHLQLAQSTDQAVKHPSTASSASPSSASSSSGPGATASSSNSGSSSSSGSMSGNMGASNSSKAGNKGSY